MTPVWRKKKAPQPPLPQDDPAARMEVLAYKISMHAGDIMKIIKEMQEQEKRHG